MVEISSHNELITALKGSNRSVLQWFTEISLEDFFKRQGDGWSASDTVDHLIKSHKPIAKALKLPKFTLQVLFGKPDRPSRAYEEICKIYRVEIDRGATASGRFLPNQENPTDAAEKKQELLSQFSTASADLVSIAQEWTESELDRYLLPHPLIGKLTIREMLYFTIYHNLRHASQEGD